MLQLKFAVEDTERRVAQAQAHRLGTGARGAQEHRSIRNGGRGMGGTWGTMCTWRARGGANAGNKGRGSEGHNVSQGQRHLGTGTGVRGQKGADGSHGNGDKEAGTQCMWAMREIRAQGRTGMGIGPQGHNGTREAKQA